MQKKNILNTPRLLEIKKKKRKVIRNRILLILVCVVIVFIALCFITRIKSLNVVNVAVAGNKIIETEGIESMVREHISGKYLWLMPKTNFVLLPKNKIKSALEEKYHRLKDINLKITNDKTLSVSVGERVGTFTWCGKTLPEIGIKPEDNKCYFVDDSGYVFDEAPYFSDGVYLKFYGMTENKNRENPAGSTFLLNYFTELATFLENIGKMGINPVSVLVKENNEIEIYLSSNILPPEAPKIIFNKDADFMKLAENLEASITTEPLVTKLKNEYKLLQYLDLRFGNKVYFKFND